GPGLAREVRRTTRDLLAVPALRDRVRLYRQMGSGLRPARCPAARDRLVPRQCTLQRDLARELDQPLRHGRNRHALREPTFVVEWQRLRRRILRRRWWRRWRRQLVTRRQRRRRRCQSRSSTTPTSAVTISK